MKFDSIKERNRFIELEFLQKSGFIFDLKAQHKIDFKINGKHIFYLIVDFTYKMYGENVFEDVKALDRSTGKYLTTPVFNLKKKIIEAEYGIKINLV